MKRWSEVNLRRVQVAVAGVVLGSIATLLFRLWGQIASIRWQFNGGYLFASVILVVGALIGWAWVWAWMLRRLSKHPIPLLNIVRIYLYTNAAKYIPGSIWNYAARSYLTQQGFSLQRIWTASFIEFVCALFTGLCLYSASLVWTHQHQPFISPVISLALTIGLLACFSPPVLARILRVVSVFRCTKELSPHLINFQWSTYVIFSLTSVIVWAGIGLAFFWLITSVYPLAYTHLPEVVGVWSLSVVISLLAIGIPQGFGVKEGILTIGLSTLVPFPIAFSVAFVARVWIIMCDLLSLALYWILEKLIMRVYRYVRVEYLS